MDWKVDQMQLEAIHVSVVRPEVQHLHAVNTNPPDNIVLGKHQEYNMTVVHFAIQSIQRGHTLVHEKS